MKYASCAALMSIVASMGAITACSAASRSAGDDVASDEAALTRIPASRVPNSVAHYECGDGSSAASYYGTGWCDVHCKDGHDVIASGRQHWNSDENDWEAGFSELVCAHRCDGQSDCAGDLVCAPERVYGSTYYCLPGELEIGASCTSDLQCNSGRCAGWGIDKACVPLSEGSGSVGASGSTPAGSNDSNSTYSCYLNCGPYMNGGQPACYANVIATNAQAAHAACDEYRLSTYGTRDCTLSSVRSGACP